MIFEHPQHNELVFTFAKLVLSFIAGMGMAYYLLSWIF